MYGSEKCCCCFIYSNFPFLFVVRFCFFFVCQLLSKSVKLPNFITKIHILYDRHRVSRIRDSVPSIVVIDVTDDSSAYCISKCQINSYISSGRFDASVRKKCAIWGSEEDEEEENIHASKAIKVQWNHVNCTSTTRGYSEIVLFSINSFPLIRHIPKNIFMFHIFLWLSMKTIRAEMQ